MKPSNGPPWMQGTMVGMALRDCKKTLAEREEGDRMVVLVTDGYSFDLANGQDEVVARELQKENIIVFIIIGKPSFGLRQPARGRGRPRRLRPKRSIDRGRTGSRFGNRAGTWERGCARTRNRPPIA